VAKEVRFSFDSEEQKSEYLAYAKRHGHTLSSLSKHALFQYVDRYNDARHTKKVPNHPTMGKEQPQARDCTGYGNLQDDTEAQNETSTAKLDDGTKLSDREQ
jgi:hypothetical protein